MEWMIDTNILLDVLMDREPFADEAEAVWQACETGKATGCVSALSLADIVYVMRKVLTPERVEELMRRILMIFRPASLTPNDLLEAASLRWRDFEDAVQAVTAERLHCDYIVTRNGKDYQNSPIPAISPRELLNRMR